MAEPNMGQKITDSLSGIGEKFSDVAASANQNFQNAVSSAGASVIAAKDSFNNSMSDFSSKAAVAVNDTGFLDSNSIIAKFGFLILVVVMFIFLVQVGMAIIGYFINNPNPVLVPGQILGTTALPPITQNPGLASSLQILWSNNAPTGLEYTWSVWLQYTPGAAPTETISGTTVTKSYTYQPVFIKGDCNKLSAFTNGVQGTSPITNTLLSINNGPGLYFYNDSSCAHLCSIIDIVGSNLPQVIDISNIPINKYFHLAIRCQNTFLDMYINGSIVKRTKLNSIPRQNFYNVYVCPAGGFNGYLSSLQYFSRALSVVDINAIASGKPNTTMLPSSNTNVSNSNFLSTYWYNSYMN